MWRIIRLAKGILKELTSLQLILCVRLLCVSAISQQAKNRSHVIMWFVEAHCSRRYLGLLYSETRQALYIIKRLSVTIT